MPETPVGAGRPQIRCLRCGAARTATNACHCSGCCRTFSGVEGFDSHRSQRGEHGECLDPATLVNQRTGQPKLVFRDGMWRGFREPTDAGG